MQNLSLCVVQISLQTVVLFFMQSEKCMKSLYLIQAVYMGCRLPPHYFWPCCVASIILSLITVLLTIVGSISHSTEELVGEIQAAEKRCKDELYTNFAHTYANIPSLTYADTALISDIKL